MMHQTISDFRKGDKLPSVIKGSGAVTPFSDSTAPAAIQAYGLEAFPDKKPEWNPPIL